MNDVECPHRQYFSMIFFHAFLSRKTMVPEHSLSPIKLQLELESLLLKNQFVQIPFLLLALLHHILCNKLWTSKAV